jgi:hypothetical protein
MNHSTINTTAAVEPVNGVTVFFGSLVGLIALSLLTVLIAKSCERRNKRRSAASDNGIMADKGRRVVAYCDMTYGPVFIDEP